MKKGDARRQAILDAAEKLFFDKGYERTAIQDILDTLKLSKGGFYHYFESKLQLLEAICEQRAEMACGRGLEVLESLRKSGQSVTKRLNQLFLQGGFFGEENVKYVALMLQTAYGGEVLQLRECIRRVTLERFVKPLSDLLNEGMAQRVFYLRSPEGTARLLIMMACDVNDEIAILAAKPNEENGDVASMIEILDAYRRAIELMICAPYGSIDIVDMKRMQDLFQSLSAMKVRKPLSEDWNLFPG